MHLRSKTKAEERSVIANCGVLGKSKNHMRQRSLKSNKTNLNIKFSSNVAGVATNFDLDLDVDVDVDVHVGLKML